MLPWRQDIYEHHTHTHTHSAYAYRTNCHGFSIYPASIDLSICVYSIAGPRVPIYFVQEMRPAMRARRAALSNAVYESHARCAFRVRGLGIRGQAEPKCAE